MRALIYSMIIFSFCFLIHPPSSRAVCPSVPMADVQAALQHQDTPRPITIAGVKYLLKAYMNLPNVPGDVASIVFSYGSPSDTYCAYDLNDNVGNLVGYADLMKQ